MTAALSASWAASGQRHSSTATSFSSLEMSARMSSSQTNFAPAFSAASTMSSRPALAMKARDETIVRTIAVRMAAVTLAGPAV